MVDKKWMPSLGDLFDRLTIVGMKYTFSPDNRDSFKEEIKDLKHDIQVELGKNTNIQLTADFLWHLIVLASFNAHIFHNESKDEDSDKNWEKLYFTHLCNGVRCRAKDKINQKLQNRIDPKVNAIAAKIPDFEPIW